LFANDLVSLAIPLPFVIVLISAVVDVIDVPVAGLPLATLYVQNPPALGCTVVAGAYGGTCYGEQKGFFSRLFGG